jgi:hypothetical protein
MTPTAENFRAITIALSSIVLLAILGFASYRATNIIEQIVYSLSFASIPPIVSIGLAMWVKNSTSQIILAIAALLYAVHCLCVMNLETGIVLEVGYFGSPGSKLVLQTLPVLWLIAGAYHGVEGYLEF